MTTKESAAPKGAAKKKPKAIPSWKQEQAPEPVQSAPSGVELAGLDAQAAASWEDSRAVLRWERNPRKITKSAVEEARKSLERFGFCAPCVAWASQRRLVAGHARLRALGYILMDDPQLQEPRHQVLKASLTGPGFFFVPVRAREFANEREAEAYALRDNNPIGDWNEALLGEILREHAEENLSTSDLGFNDKLLAAMGLDDDVEVPEPPPPRWLLVVEASSEAQQREYLATLEKQGMKCRPYS